MGEGERSRAIGTLLGVWAHPDDETYLSAGLMARTVADGHRVVCVTATRGEQGSTDEGRWPPGPALAAVRTAELTAALACLGEIEHQWLDYPDGGCAAVPDAVAVDRLARLVAQVHPGTVVTFGPDGITGHPDHVSVGRLATAAVEASGVPATVHYATYVPAWLEHYRPGLEQLGVFMDADPPVTQPQDCSLLVDLTPEEMRRKFVAITAQTSQSEPIIAALGEDFFRAGLSPEAFRPATASTRR